MQRFLLTLLILLLAGVPAFAEVVLPSVFSNQMVLQRDTQVRVWGKAEPGEQINVRFADQQHQTQADDKGHWSVTLSKMPANATGQSLLIQGKNTIEFKDVLVGEVWLASGQSNMSWTVASSANAKQEIESSANSQIRMWTAQRTVKTEPAFDVPGTWQSASPETTGHFSAVAYYFARKLQEELGVPVGILHSSWGGTPIEAWTSREKLEAMPWAEPILQRYDAAVKAYPQAKAEYDQAYKRWDETRNGPPNTGEKTGYANPDFDDASWKTMALPQSWEKAGLNKDGVVWFRKSIELPQDWDNQPLTLSLGPIDDGDTTYVNGQRVGSTEASGRGNWQRPRVYKVDPSLAKAGKLTIAVRVVDLAGEGGIWGKPEQLQLARADGQGNSITLAGEWKYLLATEMTAENRPTPRPGALFGPDHPHAPAGLFNGMIAPIIPYAIRGTIWYQGESNASRAEQYAQLFPGMIQDWRARWGLGDRPFLYVQLANYRSPSDKVEDTDWAHLRYAQLRTLRTGENLGMAVTIDIGEANDIHPRNKQDVGKRLARWALADTYGQADLVKSGPLFQNASQLPDPQRPGIVVGFVSVGSGLSIKGPGPLQGFTIAGEDEKFFPAQAEIIAVEGQPASQIRVWSDQVRAPVAVRYAWEDNPDEANLINEEGLPASPFRSDRFKGPTDGRR